ACSPTIRRDPERAMTEALLQNPALSAQSSPSFWRTPLARNVLLMLPPLVFLGVFFGYPMADIVSRSFSAADGGFTMEHYATLLERPAYVRVTLTTLELAL